MISAAEEPVIVSLPIARQLASFEGVRPPVSPRPAAPLLTLELCWPSGIVERVDQLGHQFADPRRPQRVVGGGVALLGLITPAGAGLLGWAAADLLGQRLPCPSEGMLRLLGLRLRLRRRQSDG